MVNNPFIKAVFVMGVPYMGVGWLAMKRVVPKTTSLNIKNSTNFNKWQGGGNQRFWKGGSGNIYQAIKTFFQQKPLFHPFLW